MKRHSQCCDFCEKYLIDNDVKVNRANGFVIELGYSIGGWGNRKNFIPKMDVEICDECFQQVKDKSEELKELIYKLKRQ